MTGDARETAARQFLAGARQHKPADRTHGQLARETAELRRMLGQVLDVLAIVKARDSLDGYAATVRQAFREAIRWQREHRTADDWPGQIGLYRAAARNLGLDLGDVAAGPVTPARLPDGRQLADVDLVVIRQVLTAALAAVNSRLDGCESCRDRQDGGACPACRADRARQATYRDLVARLGGAL